MFKTVPAHLKKDRQCCCDTESPLLATHPLRLYAANERTTPPRVQAVCRSGILNGITASGSRASRSLAPWSYVFRRLCPPVDDVGPVGGKRRASPRELSEQEATLRLIVQTVSGVCATRGDNFVLLEQIDVFMEEAGILPKLNYNLQLTEWTDRTLRPWQRHLRRDTKVKYRNPAIADRSEGFPSVFPFFHVYHFPILSFFHFSEDNCRVRQYHSLCSCGCTAHCGVRVCCDSVSRCGDCFLSMRQRKDRMLQFLSQRECVRCNLELQRHKGDTQKLDTTLCPEGMSGCLKSRSTSEPNQIIVRTRGRCTRRAHVFPSASGHSTHCWAYTQCNLSCTAQLR